MKNFAKILMPIALCGIAVMLAACGSDSLSSSASADSLPAGNRTLFWSASERGSNYAYDRALDYNVEDFYDYWSTKFSAFSVRCFQD